MLIVTKNEIVTRSYKKCIYFHMIFPETESFKFNTTLPRIGHCINSCQICNTRIKISEFKILHHFLIRPSTKQFASCTLGSIKMTKTIAFCVSFNFIYPLKRTQSCDICWTKGRLFCVSKVTKSWMPDRLVP